MLEYSLVVIFPIVQRDANNHYRLSHKTFKLNTRYLRRDEGLIYLSWRQDGYFLALSFDIDLKNQQVCKYLLIVHMAIWGGYYRRLSD